VTWDGDACSLVEAYRRGDLSPVEAVQEVLDGDDPWNGVCHRAEEALDAARAADVSLPFGGVPFAVKELETVAGWPFEYGTKLLEGNVGTVTTEHVTRLRERGGAIPVVQTTSSELGLVGYTSTKLHGTTTNPWDASRTPGGSSGGTAAVVSGGLVPIGTGSDGGGSIRIPAGYTGLVGMKTSFRVIPWTPEAQMEPLTSTTGCLSRSVRDTARWLDVAAGPHLLDPFSLPRGPRYEDALGSFDLAGLRVAVLTTFGGTVVQPDVAAVVEEAADALVRETGMRRVEVDLTVPEMGAAWLGPALPVMWTGLGPFWPDVRDLVTDEVAAAMDLGASYDIEVAAAIDPVRKALNQTIGDLFADVDLVLCATNPDDPYPAAGPSPHQVGDVAVERYNVGRLTMPMNITGVPAISVPVGLSPRGLPVGMQVVGRRHEDALLLDVASRWERLRPWPLTAPR
jgi:Asp-tRNA(Asn)/Glu-tRNA(Gln) amidotransferase A subunit family amidase